MNWQELKPTVKFAASTLHKRNQQLSFLQIFLKTHDLDIFTADCYKRLSIDMIEKFMIGRAENTIVGYLDCIEVLILHYGGSTKLLKSVVNRRLSLKEKVRVEGSSVKRATLPNDKILELQNQTSDIAVKILGDFTMSDFAGVRLSDLIHTCLVDNGTNSFLNLGTGDWMIRTNDRKGSDRVLTLPDELLAKLNTYSFNSEYLLSDKIGLPFNSSKIADRFKKAYGITYGNVRKEACEVTHQLDDVKITAEHAKILGHSVLTELVQYVETEPVVKKKLTLKTRKDLYLMRGLPGSGKSYSANKLDCLTLTADEFAPGSNAVRHLKCQSDCEFAMQIRTNRICIDNCHIKICDLRPYLRLAEKHGYRVVVYEPATDWRTDPKICAIKCTHPDVTMLDLQSSHNRWELTPKAIRAILI